MNTQIIKDKIKNDYILNNLASFFNNEIYLVGGSVRDILQGKELSDRDLIVTDEDAKVFAQKTAQMFDGVLVSLDEENKIYRVVLKDKANYLDISELRGDDIKTDLYFRDFTINAIAYDLENEKFIDVTGGIDDIQHKRLRLIKETNFVEDPIRILRAYRFMATTGFKPDKKLEEILIKHKNLLKQPAKERIHDEIMKLFGGKDTSKTLLKMLDNEILELIFPCVKEIKKIPSNSHHHLDLIHHLIETVKLIEFQYENTSGEVLDHLNQTNFGGYPRINHLKIAGFLHDIGKPSTWTLEDNGQTIWTAQSTIDYPKDKPYRHRFIKHDIEGEKLVKPLLKELKFSNKQIEYISNMIRYHIYPSNVISSPNIENKVMMRYVRKMGNNVIDNIILAKADRLAAQGPDVTKEMTNSNLNGLNKLLDFYLEIKQTLKPLPKLIDGNEIMEILNLKQSPKLGEIINNLHEAQLSGEVNTKNEAILYIKKYK